MIPDAQREELLRAMSEFDQNLRATDEWSKWERDGNYKFAIKNNGLLYPVKKIISMATGASVRTFSGGNEANSYMKARGFEVANLRDVPPTGISSNALQDSLKAILSDYVAARSSELFGQQHPVWDHFRRLESYLRNSKPITDRPDIRVKWSVGQGNWAKVPWISFMDQRETETTRDGVYCTYLFRQDMSGFYLTFMQGVTAVVRDLGRAEGRRRLRAQSEGLREDCDGLSEFGFTLDDSIDLRVDAELGRDYESAVIAHKLYDSTSIPQDGTLLEDLEAILSAYDNYLDTKGDSTGVSRPTSGDEMSNGTSKHSWSRPDGLPGLIARKKVDWSLLEDGSFISKDIHYAFEQANGGEKLQRGEGKSVQLIYQDRVFDARLVNVNRKGHSSDSLMIRWDSNVDLQELLKTKFYRSYAYLGNERTKRATDGRKVFALVPDDQAEYMDFYSTDEPYRFRIDFVTQSNAWIFQSNPSIFDLTSALAKLTQMTWLVKQYADKMHAGDRVYLWESGDNAGIVAVATITSEVEMIEEDDDELEFVREKDKLAGVQSRVRLRVDHVFRQRLNRKTLQEHPILKDLQILRAPQGTNFVVTPEQDAVITEMLALILVESETFDRMLKAQQVISYIQSRGFVFEPWQVAAYITALRTKGFVILAGVTGTGKSKLPALVADATGGVSRLISVRPDWTDSADVLGYVDLNGEFRPGQLLDFAQQAQDNPHQMHVCIVDEMNLARVEHYFAEVLSKIEDRRPSPDGGFQSSPLLVQKLNSGHSPYNDICLPPNLAIVGTVNMDESSHGFSRKVLDRAFTLELSDVDLTDWADTTQPSETINSSTWPVSAWFPRDIRLANKSSYTETEQATITKVIDTLVQVNAYLTPAQLQVGYRTRDEVAHFVLHAQEIGDLFIDKDDNRVDPLDLALMMKVLPRICGGSSGIRSVVLQLLGWAQSGKPIDDEEDAAAIIKAWESSGRSGYLPSARYPRTAARLCLMWDRLMSDGFTSFWM